MKDKKEILQMNKEELLIYKTSKDLDKTGEKFGDTSNRDKSRLSPPNPILNGCHHCSYCIRCYNCKYCTHCSHCYSCDNCDNCSDCLYCRDLKRKKYYICNVQFTKKEYEKKIKELKLGKSNKKIFKKGFENGIILGLLFGVIFGIVFGLIFGLIEGVVYGINSGIIFGLVFGLVGGFLYGLVGGFFTGLFKYELFIGLLSGMICGLVGGLIGGITGGLMLTFITQLIALISLNPEFVMFDFIVSGILIIIIQVIGWSFVYKLKELKKIK